MKGDVDMRAVTEHDYATYPRRFNAYKWYKSLLVGLLFLIFAAIVIPCLFFAALIVRDRPVSSYFSSMGGWRWKAFLKTFAVAFVILGIPTVVYHLV